MEEELSPQQSLELITKIIAQAKQKVSEDAILFLYMFWGLLVTFASLGQFVLLRIEAYKPFNFLPYYLFPFGTLFSWLYYRRQKVQTTGNNVVQSMIRKLWIVTSMNMYVLSFLFPMVLKNHLTPMLLILMGISNLVTGWIVQSRVVQVSGFAMNISGIAALMVGWNWQPLQMSITSFVCMFLTGLYLWYQKKVNHVV